MKKKSLTKKIGLLALMLFSLSIKIVFAQSDITAIDILLNPDQVMLDSAKVYNDLMRNNYSGPGSFSLDANHTPHISTLQCFVKTADLEKVYAAVVKVVESEKPTKNKLATKGFYYLPDKSLGLAGITTETPAWLMKFQAKIIEAVKPFIVVGTNAAFVQNADGKPIVAGLTEYVNGFIPEHSGAKFNPHVTIGLAQADFLKALLAKPYHKFTFGILAVSIYHLGDYGTAQKKLWSSAKK